MRRLHQVIVSAVALASLLGFLVYKHEYDRLKNILQVLNTFGQRDCQKTCQDIDNNNLPDTLDTPTFSGWHSIGRYHVYSAFADNADWTVRILAVIDQSAPSVTDADVISGCELWFEQQDQSRAGELVTNTDGPASAEHAVTFECRLKEAAGPWPPYAVSLLLPSKSLSDRGPPAMTYVRSRARPNATEVLRICATLSNPAVDSGMLEQFVVFHSYVGVRHFTLYDYGTTPTVLRLIQRLRRKLGRGVTVELLPWNMPSPHSVSLAASVTRRDCLARNAGVPFVLFTDIDTVLVPKLHSHLTNLLRDEIELAVSGQKLGRIRFPRRVFCTNVAGETHFRLSEASSFSIFVHTKWLESNDIAANDSSSEIVAPHSVDPFAIAGHQMSLKSGYSERRLTGDVAMLHSYENCTRLLTANLATGGYDNSIGQKFRELQISYY